MANNIVTLGPGSGFAEVYASTARTATPDTQEFEFLGKIPEGVLFLYSITAGSTLLLTPKFEAVDRTSGVAFPLLTGAQQTGVTTVQYSIGRGLPVTANLSANVIVPQILRVTITHGNATSCTYSLGMFTGT